MMKWRGRATRLKGHPEPREGEKGASRPQIFVILLTRPIQTHWKCATYLVHRQVSTRVRKVLLLHLQQEISCPNAHLRPNRIHLILKTERFWMQYFWPGDFPDAISRGHELWLNVWQMPDHRNQMSGKSSFGPVTAADLTDGNTLVLVGPCDIFRSDNCQRQN